MTGENQAAVVDFDLFGNPAMPLKDPRGRKTYKKSKENQMFVMVRAANGWSQKMIAQALGCDEKTLRKHFSRELSDARLAIEGALMDVTMAKAMGGNMQAVKAMRDMLAETAPPAPGKGKPAEDEADEPAPLGKKEQQRLDAADPSDDYAGIYSRLGLHS